MTQPKQTVRIHNKDYETVSSRIARFRETHPDYTLDSQIITLDETWVVIRAEIRDENQRLLAAGHAEEKRGSTPINRTSPLENCETSAWGRALANYGYAGDEIASADEVTRAISQQTDPEFHTQYLPQQSLSGLATDKQLKAISAMSRGVDKTKIDGYYRTIGKDAREFTKQEASKMIEWLNSLKEGSK